MHVPRLHDVLQLQLLHDDDDDATADAAWACADHARAVRLERGERESTGL